MRKQFWQKTLIAVFLSLFSVSFFSNSVFAEGSSGDGDIHNECGGAQECYARAIGLTWVYVKFDEKKGGRIIQYQNSNGHIKPISSVCGRVGGVYMLLPFMHGNGKPGLRNYFGRMESLTELYADRETVYIDRTSGSGDVELSLGSIIYKKGYSFVETDPVWFKGEPVINGPTGESQRNHYITVDGATTGYSLADFGEPVESVRAKFESMPIRYRGTSSDWSLNSDLGWFCYDPEVSGDELYSRSGVGIADAGDGDIVISERDGEAIKTYTPEKGATSISVKFKHWIVTDSNPFTTLIQPLQVKYTIYQGGDANSRSTQMTSGQFDAKGITWTEEEGEFRTLRYDNTVSVNYRNTETKVCQTIVYSPKEYNLDANSDAGKNEEDSTACIIIQPSKDTTVTLKCAKNQASSNSGNSYAITGVVRSRGGISSDTDKSGGNEAEPIYARPGDNIQFNHCLSVGAVKVTGNSGFGASRKTVATAGLYNNSHKTSPDPLIKTTFQIEAKTTTAQNETTSAAHAFGRRKIVVNSPSVTIDYTKAVSGKVAAENAAHNKSNGLIDADQTSTSKGVAFLVLSPSVTGSESINEDYRCSYGDFGAFTKNFYQIPGLDGAKCPSASKTVISDVGTIIKQTLKYNNVHAWMNDSHSVTGSCGSASKSCNNCFCSECKTPLPTPLEVFKNGISGEIRDSFKSSYMKTSNASCTCTNNTSDSKRLTNTENVGYPGNGTGVAKISGEAYKAGTSSLCYSTTDSSPISASGCSKTCGIEGGQTYSFSASGASCSYSNPTVWKSKSIESYRYYTNQYSTNESKSASVKVPYNYKTETRSDMHAGSVIYLGETVTSTFTWSIKPRVNKNVIDSPYATITPSDARVEAIEFILPADTPATASLGNQAVAITDTATGLCSYFKGHEGCHTIVADGPRAYNGDGRYAGETYSKSHTSVIPDDVLSRVGAKYCVAMGFYRTDSYGGPDGPNRVPSTKGDDGMSLSGASNLWNVSNASCRTIAKKPSVQIWGEGLYAPSAKTSLAKKRLGVTFGGDINTPIHTFGSWTEYEIITPGRTKGIASGAGLGYEAPVLSLPGGVYKDLTNDCEVSFMTISLRNTCNNGLKPGSGHNVNLSASSFVTPFKSRYYPKDFSHTGTVLSVLGSGGAKRLDNFGLEVNNDSNYVSFNGDASTGGVIRRGKGSGTLVIAVQGTLTIDNDICLGEGTCGRDKDLILGNRVGVEHRDYGAKDQKPGENDEYSGRNTTNFVNTTTGLTDISSLPQVIIFADQVFVKEAVSQIDAWIITRNLDTCYAGEDFEPDSDHCNKTLIFNGPVITNNLELNRTAGANPNVGTHEAGISVLQNLSNDGSITPAEIFNFRPDAMFWAYNQAQRFSQATVTYSRELAPRF